MYKIALNFEDGVTRFVHTLPGETVADAAYRSGLNIPMDCRDGACGTCKCKSESGQFEMTDYIEDALSDDEVRAGMVLTCCMRLESDCAISVPASSEVCVRSKQEDIHGQIFTLNRLSDSTLSFSVAGDQVKAMHFLPGQYVNVHVPGTDQKRAYSFSSLVQASNGSASFLIRIVPNGLMSTFMTESAKIGDEIKLSGPFGSFYLRDIKRPILMLAGGTGLAPFLAMLESIKATGTSHPVHLIYGVTYDSDLVEMEKLEAFASSIDNVTVSACVASEKSAWPQKGYVTNHIDASHLNNGDVDIYLCGPPPMVEAVSHFMKENNIVPANFYYEKFAASSH